MQKHKIFGIVVFDKKSFTIGEKLFKDIAEYIDDRYAENHSDLRSRRMREAEMRSYMAPSVGGSTAKDKWTIKKRKIYSAEIDDECDSCVLHGLDDIIDDLDESFSEMLLRLIDEKGMTDSECYKRANIDRKLFSKIKSKTNYKPSKPTVIAFAISLRLTLAETEEMLKKAGFALSRSNKFDIIIEYFISNGKYNIHEINEVLFAFDQSLLGVG